MSDPAAPPAPDDYATLLAGVLTSGAVTVSLPNVPPFLSQPTQLPSEGADLEQLPLVVTIFERLAAVEQWVQSHPAVMSASADGTLEMYGWLPWQLPYLLDAAHRGRRASVLLWKTSGARTLVDVPLALRVCEHQGYPLAWGHAPSPLTPQSATTVLGGAGSLVFTPDLDFPVVT